MPMIYDTATNLKDGTVMMYGYGDCDITTKHHQLRANMLIHDGHVEATPRADKYTDINKIAPEFQYPENFENCVTY